MWPPDARALAARQRRLATETPTGWFLPDHRPTIGGCWVCFARGSPGSGGAGDPAWGAAVAMRAGELVEQVVTTGVAGAAYIPGLLALRLGRLMEEAVRRLSMRPDVLLVDGTGRDHPRRAGLAIHLGAELALPTVGVTHRPLVAGGDWPADERGATSELRIGTEVVARWVRTRPGTRPLVVHPGWRLDLDSAVEVVLGTSRHRTPEPLRLARHVARTARTVPPK